MNLVQAGQLLLSLSLLIVLHEMGHFFPARWFKTRVEKFYLFFDFAPFNSLWKIKKGETEYGIGWLPLGGYVKISGMVDESMDTEALKEEPKPWEFRSKPAWQRLIIMIGGVTVNFILGFFIFAMILWGYGKEYTPTSELKYGVAFDSVYLNQGFRHGDVILKVGDKPFDRFLPGEFQKALMLDNVGSVTVRRDGVEQVIPISEDIARMLVKDGMPKGFIGERMPFYVEKARPGFPAKDAGLQQGDRIVALNNQPVEFFDQFKPMALPYKGQEVTLTYERNGVRQDVKLTLTSEGTIGVQPKGPSAFFKTERERYSLAEAFPAGVREGLDFLNTQLKAFGKIFSGKMAAKDSLGSFISIGSAFPSTWSWEAFWVITASLSILLAFMNLLPIPALDGGYVVFLLWEVITGRRVSDKTMEKAVTFGFFLLMGLMIYAFGLDLWRFVFKKFF